MKRKFFDRAAAVMLAVCLSIGSISVCAAAETAEDEQITAEETTTEAAAEASVKRGAVRRTIEITTETTTETATETTTEAVTNSAPVNSQKLTKPTANRDVTASSAAVQYDEWGDRVISMVVDGNRIESDQAPIIQNSSVMVPFRAIAEAFGCDVQWDPELKAVTLTKGTLKVYLLVDSSIAIVTDSSGNRDVQLTAVPMVYNGRVMVPVRFIAEVFGYEVDWESDERTVYIYTSKEIEDYYDDLEDYYESLYGDDYDDDYWEDYYESLYGDDDDDDDDYWEDYWEDYYERLYGDDDDDDYDDYYNGFRGSSQYSDYDKNYPNIDRDDLPPRDENGTRPAPNTSVQPRENMPQMPNIDEEAAKRAAEAKQKAAEKAEQERLKAEEEARKAAEEKAKTEQKAAEAKQKAEEKAAEAKQKAAEKAKEDAEEAAKKAAEEAAKKAAEAKNNAQKSAQTQAQRTAPANDNMRTNGGRQNPQR